MNRVIFTDQYQSVSLDAQEGKQVVLTVVEPLINESDSHAFSITGLAGDELIDMTLQENAQRLYEDADVVIAESLNAGVTVIMASVESLHGPSPEYLFRLDLKTKVIKYRKVGV
ncbi:hypothetical protein [Vibrio agarivorans]|uniref:Uncharacterized protein n=1 Tax=Vibrio agarivorans TaxID=153622 RepID=A0ABT7Y783_9VIBR|nr:hypothetical protein [Vibrio agarivorans]MDN2483843.1 hypothetical protein [Vibrio agarivorans]